jgi:hypothetical protein
LPTDETGTRHGTSPTTIIIIIITIIKITINKAVLGLISPLEELVGTSILTADALCFIVFLVLN